MPRSHGWTLFHGLGDTAEIVPVLPFAWPTAPVTTGNATSWAKGVSGL